MYYHALGLYVNGPAFEWRFMRALLASPGQVLLRRHFLRQLGKVTLSAWNKLQPGLPVCFLPLPPPQTQDKTLYQKGL